MATAAPPRSARAPAVADARADADPVGHLPVWAIVGPTASGKSAAAMALAREAVQLEVTGGHDVEIVAVDAFTIYRGLDVTTATPSPEDRARVPHHLIDVLDPSESVSVAQFQGWARDAIRDIHARDRVPLLVGGSGLYFRAVVDDLEFPPTDPEVREALEVTWAHDPPAAHAALAGVDPAAAALIEPDNLRRTVRALEVMELTGRPFSSFRTTWDDHSSRYRLAVDYVEPPAEVLRERIQQRTEQMVAGGLLDEVAALDRATLSTTASKGIGVAEALAVLDGTAPADELVAAIATRTWHYARRQRSWFRRDPRCAGRHHDAAGALVAARSTPVAPASTRRDEP